MSARPFKHEDTTIRFKKQSHRANGYNLLTGAPHEIVSVKNSYAKQTLLPPQKDFINNGHSKQEYRSGMEASPRLFHR